MNWIPSVPSWDGLHVVVVHMPIALWIFAPVLVVLGLIPGRFQTGSRLATVLLQAAATAGAFLAVETGEAAGRLVSRTAAISTVLEQHQELAEVTASTFAAVTAAYALFVLISAFWSPLRKPAVAVSLQILLLLATLAGCLLVANTGHLGGRLVHEFGVQASI